MRTLKALLSTLGVVAISAVLATSAFASEDVAASAVYDPDTQTVSASNYATTDGQMTALIVAADVWENIDEGIEASDIMYINQFDDADAAVLDEMGVVKALDEGDYYLLIGGENAEEIAVIAFSYTVEATEPEKSTVKGDVTGDEVCNAADLTAIAKHVGKLVEITDVQYAANGDVANDDGVINAADLTKVARFVGKLIDTLD